MHSRQSAIYKQFGNKMETRTITNTEFLNRYLHGSCLLFNEMNEMNENYSFCKRVCNNPTTHSIRHRSLRGLNAFSRSLKCPKTISFILYFQYPGALLVQCFEYLELEAMS